MDAIEALDDGAYAHFSFVALESPQIVDFMYLAFLLSGNKSVGVLTLIILAILLGQKRFRASIVAVLAIPAAANLIELIRYLVPRSRPQGAAKWIGEAHRFDSYPSEGVFLFLLCMILLGSALWPVLRGRWSRVALVLVAAFMTVWVCLSQFFLDIAYVTDVIGAIAGASLFGWIAVKLMSPARQPLAETSSHAIQDLSRTSAIQSD